MRHVQVLVVGGSLVGLSAALFLAAEGVAALTVERHAGSSPHPRAIGYTERTLELFRAVGLGDAIEQAPAGFRLRRARAASLAGGALAESAWTPPAAGGAVAGESFASPVRGAAIPQDRLEPILQSRAAALGADIRRGVELVAFAQDAGGVTARLRDRATGAESRVRADYLLACDGGDSRVRAALNIGRAGRGLIRTVRSVLFRAPLDDYLRGGISQWEIEQPGFRAFLTTYADGRWVLMFTDDLERDAAALEDAVRRAIGRDDVPLEIVATGRWRLAALVAERFSAGRVFLAGDAAHQLPPTRGGYGANTGIHDVHNLAWKLRAVLAGAASAALLDTYDQERRPVAWTRHEQIFARPDYAADACGWSAGVPVIEDEAMELGQLYRSAAILGAGPELPAARRPVEWQGQPGTRAPHFALQGGSSFLDLLGRGWYLAAASAAWRPIVAEAAAGPIPLRTGLLGKDVVAADADAAALLGIGAAGASLIRPDGYVAWRAARPVAPAAFARAFAQAACTSGVSLATARER